MRHLIRSLVRVPSAISMILAMLLPIPVMSSTPGGNGKIAFASNRDVNNTKIWVMDSDGNNARRIEPFNGQNDSGDVSILPDWSPDGTRIVFQSNKNPPWPNGNFEIYIMNADGSGLVQLTNGDPSVGASQPLHTAREPSWSPDGMRIVFRGDVDGPNTHIWVMSAHVTMFDYHFAGIRLTNDALSDVAPEWSPDGSRIVFVRVDGGGDHIWLMNSDGTDQHFLVTGHEPTWSPDGTRILYRAPASDLPFNPYNQLFSINADGSGAVRITADSWGHSFPDWSPNGTKLSYFTWDGIHSVNVDGSGDVTLWPGFPPGDIEGLDWQAMPPAVWGEVSGPGSATPLTVGTTTSGQLDLAWQLLAGATTYRIIGGSLSSLQPSGVTALNAAPLACGIVGASTSLPLPDGSLFLLVASEDGVGGVGPLGNASNGTPRMADLTCP